jgi:hypothetical protein
VTTWVAAQERSGAAILDAAGQGRTLLSFGVGAPLLLRLGDELLAIDGDGLYLERLNGRRSVVRVLAVLAAEEPGPYRLENAARATLAMTMWTSRHQLSTSVISNE